MGEYKVAAMFFLGLCLGFCLASCPSFFVGSCPGQTSSLRMSPQPLDQPVRSASSLLLYNHPAYPVDIIISPAHLLNSHVIMLWQRCSCVCPCCLHDDAHGLSVVSAVTMVLCPQLSGKIRTTHRVSTPAPD